MLLWMMEREEEDGGGGYGGVGDGEKIQDAQEHSSNTMLS